MGVGKRKGGASFVSNANVGLVSNDVAGVRSANLVPG